MEIQNPRLVPGGTQKRSQKRTQKAQPTEDRPRDSRYSTTMLRIAAITLSVAIVAATYDPTPPVFPTAFTARIKEVHAHG